MYFLEDRLLPRKRKLMISRRSSKYVTPLFVTTAGLEDAEIEEALELNSAEDKMLQ
jgi:hypothetical protein